MPSLIYKAIGKVAENSKEVCLCYGTQLFRDILGCLLQVPSVGDLSAPLPINSLFTHTAPFSMPLVLPT